MAEPTEPHPKVVDLMEALEESIERAKAARKAHRQAHRPPPDEAEIEDEGYPAAYPEPQQHAIAKQQPCAFTHIGPMCDDPYERCEGCRPERDGTRWVVTDTRVERSERRLWSPKDGEHISVWREVDSDA